MFIHSGYLHLIINVFSQIALGLPLEKAYGKSELEMILLLLDLNLKNIFQISCTISQVQCCNLECVLRADGGNP